ncbi:MAG: sodium:solute symporter [Bacteroidota bacterium]|nr:sodium:solute symporter [Bacteroidota bacterium]MDP4190409.1 sodium:solute symporter [Bacteroidota bacterium]MDP4194548.1 sodium:solute symporter [Bacteroidota bacterium]
MDRTIDYVIIVLYLIFIAIFGVISGGKQKSAKDYFLGAKAVPWWAICFSIVAAETSTLTFISIPGLAYLTNLNFLQVTLGYLLGRIIVAYILLPQYYKGELTTAYAFLEKRFGNKTRSFASIVFLFTRTAADGVRLYATAIPLKLMLHISDPVAIAIIACVTLVYTYTGGVKGVIWVEVIQMFIYLGGATIAFFFLLHLLPQGWTTLVMKADPLNKLNVINFGFDKGLSGFFSNPYTLISGILGGAFLSMASHGTDQLIVQRLLTAKNLKGGRKAIIGSGIIVNVQFVIFLLVGLALFAFYGPLNLKSDEIFPKFILEQLPVGISGIIIAGLFSAAMSTLAGSISALSSSTMLDLFKGYFKRKNFSDSKELAISRMVTVIWTILLICSAMFFMTSPKAVVELALSISSFTYGGLLGTFLLGLLVKKATQEDALASFTSGIFVMITVISLKLVAWTWYTLIGVATTLIIGIVLSNLSSKDENVPAVNQENNGLDPQKMVLDGKQTN